jgi:hypothetical protein
MIYNGKAQRVPGCSAAGLCNVSFLLNALGFGQSIMPCDFENIVVDDDYYINTDDDQPSNTNDCGSTSSKHSKMISRGEVAGLCIMSLLIGTLLGCFLVLLYQKRSKSVNILHQEESHDAINMATLTSNPMLKVYKQDVTHSNNLVSVINTNKNLSTPDNTSLHHEKSHGAINIANRNDPIFSTYQQDTNVSISTINSTSLHQDDDEKRHDAVSMATLTTVPMLSTYEQDTNVNFSTLDA